MSSMVIRTLGLLSLFVMVGCASQYDCYPCGKVSCNYCPPKPLPFSNDPSCNCTDSPGRVYLASLQTSARQEYAPELVSDSYYQVNDPAKQQQDDSKSENSKKMPSKPSTRELESPTEDTSNSTTGTSKKATDEK